MNFIGIIRMIKEPPDPRNFFAHEDLNTENREYLEVHSTRYKYLLSVVENIRSRFPETNDRILDVGPSFFTILLKKYFPSDTILSLGLDYEESRGGHLPKDIKLDKNTFFSFNLNDTQFFERWIKIPECEIVVLAEVLEHLYTAPTLILKFLNTAIRPGGYLIIQTPNAASFKNRMLLLSGRNPYQMIRETADNPGHYREYTKDELIRIAGETGFRLDHFEFKEYFNPRNLVEKIYFSVTRVMPGAMRNGITAVFRKEE